MNFILRWLTGSFGSYIMIAVAVAFVALGAAWGVQTWRVHSLTADVAKVKLDAAERETAAAKAAILDKQRGDAIAAEREAARVAENSALRSRLAGVMAAKPDACSEAPALPAVLEGLR